MTKPEGLGELQKLQGMDLASFAAIQKMIAVYYGMITLIDESIGTGISLIMQPKQDLMRIHFIF
ncbi:hypothetical protein O9H85_04710 [Paenibacillus filicis]|uniref:Uncharacterized protein n=1 Tax=Paenibacillus gyeongsangnamensis TaxID=3388067 RepID=A0ABT4Q4C7_9BACL|nr:hypothetical protein [Paenibacillus filicis]MCZ8511733.1 hypothetical protein [Paenibacillus filicis]